MDQPPKSSKLGSVPLIFGSEKPLEIIKLFRTAKTKE
jgi:hypothetical protein